MHSRDKSPVDRVKEIAGSAVLEGSGRDAAGDPEPSGRREMDGVETVSERVGKGIYRIRQGRAEFYIVDGTSDLWRLTGHMPTDGELETNGSRPSREGKEKRGA